MIPQPITLETDPEVLARRWLIAPKLACKLRDLSGRLGFGISIISGHRSCEEQTALIESGRPAAPCDRSTHVATCPATGADIWPGAFPVVSVKARILAEGSILGLRVGGGSPLDEDGLPTDWNHLDLGPVTS